MKGFFAKKNTEAKRKLKEYRIKDIENYKEGNEFGLEIFKDIKFVDTRSKNYWKRFCWCDEKMELWRSKSKPRCISLT